MPKGKLIAPSQDKLLKEELKPVWDKYGHEISFEKLDGFTLRSDHCYVVVRWKTADGKVDMADLTRGSTDDEWDMQNDGYEPITEEQWKTLKIIPDCDWFGVDGKNPIGD